jgi:hypothetical protein
MRGDEPPVGDRVATGPGGVDKERGEALHPPVLGHMIDLEPTIRQLFDVAVGEPEPQIPAHREDDDLGWEPEALERRARDGYRTSMNPPYPTAVAFAHGHRPMQQTRAECVG